MIEAVGTRTLGRFWTFVTFVLSGQLSPTFQNFWRAFGRTSTYPATPRRHLDLPSCSGTTFRLILLLRDDISTYPGALGLHCDLPSCSETTFRATQLLWDDISIGPAAPGRHFDLPSGARMTFRLILLLRDDLSIYTVALG